MKKAILLVAFGTMTVQGRHVLAVFDKRVRAHFPGISVRWAYTSTPLRERLALRRCKSDSVEKALRKMLFEHFERIVVQPLQTISGFEHEEILNIIGDLGGRGDTEIAVGAPLLACEEDVFRVAATLLSHLPENREEGEDVIFMGHGSKHPANVRYAELHSAVQARDVHVHVGTMQGPITLKTLLPSLSSRRVWLMPLLSTVGRHTLNDMAGPGRNSWRMRLEAEGYLCEPVLKGTVEHSGIADIWLDHLLDVAEPLFLHA
ncbi:MAG: sirohydrochlorin cobaltochelatase [Desulfovibrio sp.]|nr:sirohydrochlorin cobaltochelatase [Desulfovibrio sp.]